jgi:outer membrane lipoprotein SlyB
VILKQAKLALLAGTLAAFLSPGAAQASSPIEYRYAVARADTQPQYVDAVARRRYVRHSRYVVRRRSTAKSLAIVGGSAAGGAAIGALAGGGKGAGIGALIGGAGGLIYDRRTHKKVVRRY